LPSNYKKVNVQPRLGNNGSSNFDRNLNHQTSYIYKSAGGQAGKHEQGQVAQLVLYAIADRLIQMVN
jgi:hypothetical protein